MPKPASAYFTEAAFVIRSCCLITDGSMDLVRLTDDLSAPVGEPTLLFHAT